MVDRAGLETTVRRSEGGSVIDVWLVPGARRTEIVGVHDEALRVRVAAPPEGGKANHAAERLLAETLGVKPVLAGGRTSRRKQFHIPDRSPAETVEAIYRHLTGSHRR